MSAPAPVSSSAPASTSVPASASASIGPHIVTAGGSAAVTNTNQTGEMPGASLDTRNAALDDPAQANQTNQANKLARTGNNSNLHRQIDGMAALQRSAEKTPGKDWPPEFLEIARKVPDAKVVKITSTNEPGGVSNRFLARARSAMSGSKATQAITYKGVTFVIQEVNGKNVVVASGKDGTPIREISQEFLKELEKAQNQGGAGEADGGGLLTVKNSAVSIGDVEIQFPTPKATLSVRQDGSSHLMLDPARLKNDQSEEAKFAKRVAALSGESAESLSREIGLMKAANIGPEDWEDVGNLAFKRDQLAKVANLLQNPVEVKKPPIADAGAFLENVGARNVEETFNEAREHLNKLLCGNEGTDCADTLLRAISLTKNGENADTGEILEMYEALGGELGCLTNGEFEKIVAMGRDIHTIATGEDASAEKFQDAMARLRSEQQQTPVVLVRQGGDAQFNVKI
ncbi:MAG: hypothetical protein LBB15_02710, partial [Puniceicoccales bacterium]|nr:hypothetical protein [Puniceicoccales bacterium]